MKLPTTEFFTIW